MHQAHVGPGTSTWTNWPRLSVFTTRSTVHVHPIGPVKLARPPGGMRSIHSTGTSPAWGRTWNVIGPVVPTLRMGSLLPRSRM